MGYIKKLKSNELVGGTDKTTIYPVTSAEAVFEEVIEDGESNFKSQKFLNNNITGDRINEGTITDYNIATGTITKGKLTSQVQTMLDEGQKKALTPKGNYNPETEYEALDLVFDPATNSSYISLQTPNAGHPVDENAEGYEEGWWEKTLDGTAVNTAQAAIDAKVGQLETQVGTAITQAETAVDEAKQETLNAYTQAEALAQQITDWSSSEISSIPSYADQHPLSNRASSAQIGYFECGTSSATQASNQIKAVTAGGYALPTSGGAVKIKMYAANTYTPTTNNPVKLQFNADATTLKELKYNGEAVSPSNTWDANEVISVYYDGSVYQASNAQGGNKKEIESISEKIYIKRVPDMIPGYYLNKTNGKRIGPYSTYGSVSDFVEVTKGCIVISTVPPMGSSAANICLYSGADENTFIRVLESGTEIEETSYVRFAYKTSGEYYVNVPVNKVVEEVEEWCNGLLVDTTGGSNSKAMKQNAISVLNTIPTTFDETDNRVTVYSGYWKNLNAERGTSYGQCVKVDLTGLGGTRIVASNLAASSGAYNYYKMDDNSTIRIDNTLTSIDVLVDNNAVELYLSYTKDNIKTIQLKVYDYSNREEIASVEHAQEMVDDKIVMKDVLDKNYLGTLMHRGLISNRGEETFPTANAMCLKLNVTEYIGYIAHIKGAVNTLSSANNGFLMSDNSFVTFAGTAFGDHSETIVTIPENAVYLCATFNTDPNVNNGDGPNGYYAYLVGNEPNKTIATQEYVEKQLNRVASGMLPSNTKWYVIGDSISDYRFYATKHYYDYICEKNNLPMTHTAQALAVAGATFANNGENNYLYTQATAISSIDDATLITVMAGGNDWLRQGLTTSDAIPFGEVELDANGRLIVQDNWSDCNTFCRGVAFLLKYLVQTHPTATIALIHTTRGNQSPAMNNGEQRRQLEEYWDASELIASYFSIPVIPLGRQFGSSTIVPESFNIYYKDGGHLNDAGHKRAACIVEPWLKMLLNSVD